MDGSAVFTTVMSSSNMNVATDTARRVHHLRAIGISPGVGVHLVRSLDKGTLPDRQATLRKNVRYPARTPARPAEGVRDGRAPPTAARAGLLRDPSRSR